MLKLTSSIRRILPDRRGEVVSLHRRCLLLQSFGILPERRDVKPQYSGRPSDQDVAVMFQPCQVGTYQVPNRMVYAPLTRCRAIDSNPQKNMIEYYRQRGKGSEGGLVIAEGTVISDTGYGYESCCILCICKVCRMIVW